MDVKTDSRHYTDIANAIRLGLVSNAKYLPAEMAGKINDITAIITGMITGAIDSIKIPNGITAIRDQAFVELSGLKSIDIPNTVVSIGASAFQETGLESVIIPDSVTSIGNFAFVSCGNLTAVHIGSGVTDIGLQAFAYSAIEEIHIPASVQGSMHSVFAYCANLRVVRFHGTPANVLNNTFNSCTAITDIYVPWSEGEVLRAPWGATNATIHYNTP